MLLVSSVAKNESGLNSTDTMSEKKPKKTSEYLLCVEAITSNTLKDAVDVGRGAHELVCPKLVCGIADEFDKRDEDAPGMRFQQNQAFH